jgi:hypothetical protein
MDGSGPGNDVESHLLSNKDTLMNSLWKLNVVDIEITVIHVCQMVRLSISTQENLGYLLCFTSRSYSRTISFYILTLV